MVGAKGRSVGLLSAALCLGLAGCAGTLAESAIESAAESIPVSPMPTATAQRLDPTAAVDFYYPSANETASSGPGEIIDSVEILAPAGIRAWMVVYGSTGLDGEPVAVSGLVLAPTDPPSGSGYPIIAWAHGTTGIADMCAPSRTGVYSAPIDLAANGYVISATDYQGLGTEGVHPYIIGISEGRSVLDSIRAAQNLAGAHAGTETVIAGLSQGGHAALWAGQLAPTYAPDLDIRGALAGSPPADLSAFASWTFEAAGAGRIETTFAPMLLYGVWSATYGLPLPFLTDGGQRIAASAPEGCDPSGLTANPYVSDPTLIPEWSQRLNENSPGATQTDIPYLVVSPSDDALVSYDSQVSGVGALCAVGDTVELRTVSGGHDAMLASSAVWGAALDWIEARFAGTTASSTCGPS
jgi:hypothetical protein